MKITDVEVIRMQANAEPSNNWLFVRVHTDAGITGIGEGSLHLDMSIPNVHRQELFLNSLPYYQEVLTNPLIIEDGYGTPPAGPGWGTELDEAVLAKYPPAEYTPIGSEPYLAF